MIFACSVLQISANPSSYDTAETELKKAWDIKYPLPFEKVVKRDPLNRGVKQVVRKSGKYWMYNFEIFMPKYKREGNSANPQQEGRNLILYFLWNPNLSEDPYKIELGEPNEGN